MMTVYLWMPKSGKKHLTDDSVFEAWLYHIFSLNWIDQTFEYGHAAFAIEGRCYGSYWPARTNDATHDITLSYDEDVAECGREADHQIELYHFDESEMVKVWRAESERPFQPIRHNCCTVTTNVIHTGFHASVFSSFKHAAKVHWRAATHPFRSLNVLLDDTINVLSFREPYSVLELAEYYKMLTDD